MAVHVMIPTPLRQFTGGESVVPVSACATVRDALDQLVAGHPSIAQHLFADAGVLRSFVNVYVNRDNVRDGDGLATPVQEGDTLTIVPSIAGGSV